MSYNAARSRVMQLEFDSMSGGTPLHYSRKRTYALGSTLELNYNNTINSGSGQSWTLKNIRIYVPGPDGIIGSREFDPTQPVAQQEKAYVYHYDHLGSITAITDFGASSLSADTGGKPGKFSEDAWDQRRNPFTWSGAPVTGATDPNKSDDGSFGSLTPRGFTGHEMLDDLGLVHMNGRIYDPLLGRFLSADVVIQAPGNLQSYNRYSYVLNNPLTLTDPSGFVAIDDEIRKGIARDIQRAADVAELVHGKANGNLDIANAQHRTFQKVLNTSEFADFIVTEQRHYSCVLTQTLKNKMCLSPERGLLGEEQSRRVAAAG